MQKTIRMETATNNRVTPTQIFLAIIKALTFIMIITTKTVMGLLTCVEVFLRSMEPVLFNQNNPNESIRKNYHEC